MAESNHQVAITIALIGVVGTLGAALISNWDKIFASSPAAISTPAPQAEPQPLPDATPNIGGDWRDSNYPSNGTRIIQNGTKFSFTRWGVLPDGTTFESSG